MPKPIIYAPNVGAGGGLVLLQAMLKWWPTEVPLVAFLDLRAQDQIKLPRNAAVFWCKPSFRSRFNAELGLRRAATVDATVFCFHNLPPIFKVRSQVRCYVHNLNLIGVIPSAHLSGWVRTRIAIERFIARWFAANVDQYIVQTPSMARALRQWYSAQVSRSREPEIEIAPFVDDQAMPQKPDSAISAGPLKWDFLFVSDGTTHKNHLRLFDAWVLLAKEGLYPSLALTLRSDRDRALCQTLAALKSEHGLAITDLGQLPHAEILACYAQAKALLFASYAESYGIPFLEAKAAGLPILAAELDFVRDMCAPVETFDPFSAVSIARAVKRFLYDRHDMVTPLSPRAFVDRLIADNWGTGDSASAVDTDPAPLPSMPENKHGNRDRNRAKAAHDKP